LPAIRRLMREDWLATAKKILVQSGVDDIKIDRLAKRLKVTRGSFYWHFRSRSDLLSAILKDWEVRNQVEISQIQDRWAETGPDLNEVSAIWLGEDPDFQAQDLAIRSWGRKAPPVAQAVHRIDEAWIDLFSQLYRQDGYDADQSLVRARIAYFHQVGYYALALREDLDTRIRLAPIFYEALTGKKPGKSFDDVIARIRTQKRSREAKP